MSQQQNSGFTIVEQIAALRCGIDIMDLEDVQQQYFDRIYIDPDVSRLYYEEFTAYQEDLFQQLAQEIQNMSQFGITRTEYETYFCDPMLDEFLKPEPEKSQIVQQLESHFDVNAFLESFKKQLQAEITRALREQQREEKMMMAQKKLSKIQRNATPNLLISQLPFEQKQSKLAEIRANFPENARRLEIEREEQNALLMESMRQKEDLATRARQKELDLRKDRMFQSTLKFQEHQSKIQDNLYAAQRNAELVQKQQEWLISLDEKKLAELHHNQRSTGMENSLRLAEERAIADKQRFAKYEEMQNAKMKQISDLDERIRNNVAKVQAEKEGRLLNRKDKVESRMQFANERIANFKQSLLDRQEQYMKEDEEHEMREMARYNKEAQKYQKAWLESLSKSQQIAVQRDQSSRLKESMALQRIQDNESRLSQNRTIKNQQEECVTKIRQLRSKLSGHEHGSKQYSQIKEQIEAQIKNLEQLNLRENENN